MDINQKLKTINQEISDINKSLITCDIENINRLEILKNLSTIYLNIQRCAQNLKYIKMKECEHIFIKRTILSGKSPIHYCINCNLNNMYECINSENYILNDEDKIYKKIYEETKTKGILLFEKTLSTDEVEEILNEYKKLSNEDLTRKEIISKLKHKQLIKK